ncbi:hypothetical protein VTK73DRAFT_1691 [Phialemonium thermophilum]|uniref:Uncharacterized protein n=1 Tax=Phialemonium thermophilum TaxID=223376 RepID=A0ABR3VT27_9PEZI
MDPLTQGTSTPSCRALLLRRVREPALRRASASDPRQLGLRLLLRPLLAPPRRDCRVGPPTAAHRHRHRGPERQRPLRGTRHGAPAAAGGRDAGHRRGGGPQQGPRRVLPGARAGGAEPGRSRDGAAVRGAGAGELGAVSGVRPRAGATGAGLAEGAGRSGAVGASRREDHRHTLGHGSEGRIAVLGPLRLDAGNVPLAGRQRMKSRFRSPNLALGCADSPYLVEWQT